MVLVFAEATNGKFKKTALEAVNYGKNTSDLLGGTCTALVIGEVDNPGQLGLYGADKVIQVSGANTESFDSSNYAKSIADVAQQQGASVVVLSNSVQGKSLTGRLSVRLNAGCVSGAISLPDTANGFVVRKNVFSGKGIAAYSLTSANKVVSVMGNALPLTQIGAECPVEKTDSTLSSIREVGKEKHVLEGDIALPDAETVVSAGRGMKGPENWGIIEELAGLLGAATACSRPVADSDWRPHHEHVGQTGVAIRPNLYFAIGISGAIQHLAGVNSSKVIVVINKDSEAPFFKAATYGIVGDLFEVVPKLNEAVRRFKSA